MYGLVILAPESEDRDKMMGIVNVMCGNVGIECAFAVLKAFNIKRDQQNINEQTHMPTPQKGQSCNMIYNRARYHEKCFRPIVDVFRCQLFFKTTIILTLPIIWIVTKLGINVSINALNKCGTQVSKIWFNLAVIQ